MSDDNETIRRAANVIQRFHEVEYLSKDALAKLGGLPGDLRKIAQKDMSAKLAEKDTLLDQLLDLVSTNDERFTDRSLLPRLIGYILFDKEALQRENDYLRKQLERVQGPGD